MANSPPVVIIGAGIGGLACAAELAAAGVEVLLLESHDGPGGKLREVEVGGLRIDAGPTVFTMRWVFDELFDAAGARLDDHVALTPAATLARHVWDGGACLDLHADVEASAAAIEALAGRGEADGYRAFCERAQAIYRTLEAPYLRAPRPTPWSLGWRVGLGGLPRLARIAPFATLWDELGRYFRDARLRQLFGRYATYCGSSPFLAPATLMLIAHVERSGLWTVDAGMHALAREVAALAQRHGAQLRYRAEVRRIVVRGARAAGVELADGERLDAAAVVFNGDCAALGAGLLGDAAAPAGVAFTEAAPSLSAITWALPAEPLGLPLLRHNVFFSADSEREFAALFRERRLPREPTVYVCAQDRGSGAEGSRRAGPERLLCLINAPAHAAPLEVEPCLHTIERRLARCGLKLRPRSAGLATTPADFGRLFPGRGGALYGAATHGWKASFSRPSARSALAGLYLAGGSVHPGPGLPMAAMSGRLAAQALLQDRGRRSTPKSPTAATPGGTSTR